MTTTTLGAGVPGLQLRAIMSRVAARVDLALCHCSTMPVAQRYPIARTGSPARPRAKPDAFVSIRLQQQRQQQHQRQHQRQAHATTMMPASKPGLLGDRPYVPAAPHIAQEHGRVTCTCAVPSPATFATHLKSSRQRDRVAAAPLWSRTWVGGPSSSLCL